jgi:hypothetical protein
MRVMRVAVLVALLLGACGQTVETATTTATTIEPEVSTTPAQTGSDDGNQIVSVDDIPQACIDAFANYLRAIEPVIQDIDFDTATIAEFEAIGTELEPATATFEEETAGAGCEDIDLDLSDEESFELMIDLAEREAPAAVAYFEWIRDFSASMGEGTGSAASGDCETDIDALQVIVDQGGTMSDLTMTEIGTVGGLITSISTVCSAERTQEFFSKADVAAFLESGG